MAKNIFNFYTFVCQWVNGAAVKEMKSVSLAFFRSCLELLDLQPPAIDNRNRGTGNGNSGIGWTGIDRLIYNFIELLPERQCSGDSARQID